jgi:hypothetical protein
MATQADVRRIARALPGTEEDPRHFAFSVRHQGKAKGRSSSPSRTTTGSRRPWCGWPL